jgi:hypothetical protein
MESSFSLVVAEAVPTANSCLKPFEFRETCYSCLELDELFLLWLLGSWYFLDGKLCRVGVALISSPSRSSSALDLTSDLLFFFCTATGGSKAAEWNVRRWSIGQVLRQA